MSDIETSNKFTEIPNVVSVTISNRTIKQNYNHNFTHVIIFLALKNN
jgi:hypothetical protein